MSSCGSCGAPLRRQIRVGDEGTAFVFTLVDLSEIDCDSPSYCDPPVLDVSDPGATFEVLFSKPDGTVETVAGSLVTDGTDGQIQCYAGPGLLNAAGQWKRQARVTMGGDVWSSSIVCFEVHANLDT